MFKNIILLLFLFVSFKIVFFNNLNTVSADTYKFEASSGLDKTAFPAGYNTTREAYTGDSSAISGRIGAIIKGVLSFVGVLFLILMIYGGYLWMTASGNEQQVEKAKGLITNAVIGLIIVMSAYAITFMIYLYSDTAT